MSNELKLVLYNNELYGLLGHYEKGLHLVSWNKFFPKKPVYGKGLSEDSVIYIENNTQLVLWFLNKNATVIALLLNFIGTIL